MVIILIAEAELVSKISSLNSKNPSANDGLSNKIIRLCSQHISKPLTYKGGPKSNRTLNLERELEVGVQCATRCCRSTQYSSSLPRGINIS